MIAWYSILLIKPYCWPLGNFGFNKSEAFTKVYDPGILLRHKFGSLLMLLHRCSVSFLASEGAESPPCPASHLSTTCCFLLGLMFRVTLIKWLTKNTLTESYKFPDIITIVMVQNCVHLSGKIGCINLKIVVFYL